MLITLAVGPARKGGCAISPGAHVRARDHSRHAAGAKFIRDLARGLEQPPLLDFGSWGPCKVAVQFRCHVSSENRGTKPPAKPIAAFQAASAVVARWLVETPLRLPSEADCEACLQRRDGST